MVRCFSKCSQRLRASCRFSSPDSALPWPGTRVYKTILSVTFFRTWRPEPNYHKIRESTCLQFYFLSVLHLRFYRLTMSYKHETRPVLTKKINSDFLHGRKTLKRDKHGALFQSSPKINHMLITTLISIQWKSSRFLSPVSMVLAWNAGPTN